jgi:hypothetical protein
MVMRRISGLRLSSVCRVSALLVLLIAFNQPSFGLAVSMPQSRIEGVVVDQTGAPVVGAEVVFTSGALSARRVTDSDGKFNFEGLSSTGGTLSARAPGFRS